MEQNVLSPWSMPRKHRLFWNTDKIYIKDHIMYQDNDNKSELPPSAVL